MPFKYGKFKKEKSLFEEVAKILHGKKLSGNKKWMHEIIHGDIGADRIDYLSRDSHHTGILFGIVDTEQILRYIELINSSLHLGNKKQDIDASYKEKISRTIGENILISRIHHYNMLVENPKAVGIEKILYKCLHLYLKNLNDDGKVKKKISEIFLEWDDSRLIQEIKDQTEKNSFIQAHFPVLKGEKQLNVLYRYDIHSFDPNLRFWLIMLEKNYRNKIEEDLEKEIKNKLNIKDTIVDLSYLSSIPELRMDGIGGVTRFFYDESYISQGAIRDQMRNLALTIFSLKKTKREHRYQSLYSVIEKVASKYRKKALNDMNEFLYRNIRLLEVLFKETRNSPINGIVDFYRTIKEDKELSKYYTFKKIGYPTKFPYSHELFSDIIRLDTIGIIKVRSRDIPYAYEDMLDRSLSKIDKKKKKEIFSHSFEYNSISFGIPKWARWTIKYNIDVIKSHINRILDQVKEIEGEL